MLAKLIEDGWVDTGQFFNGSLIFKKRNDEENNKRVFLNPDGSVKEYIIELPHP